MSQNENTGTTDLKNQLTTLNERILQAEEAGLKDDLALHLHEDFTIIRAGGAKQNRETFLKAVEANAHRDRTAEKPEIRLYRDCAVVIIRVTTSEKQDGALTSRHFWNNRVFIRQEEQWRCAAWQVTEIRE